MVIGVSGFVWTYVSEMYYFKLHIQPMLNCVVLGQQIMTTCLSPGAIHTCKPMSGAHSDA